MARPLRIEYEGAFYHITARGNERRKIYYSKADYKKFKSYLKEAQQKYGYLIHCYVLMTNHYHLLIETKEANLSKVMHYINSSYTNYINIKRRRSGHLFQGRYKSILIDRDSYLLELSRYLHLNPVRAKMVDRPEDYPYSSYVVYISRDKGDIVYRDLILEMMSKNKRNAKERYRDFMDEAIGVDVENPLKDVYGGMILGGANFIKEILDRLKDEEIQKEDISFRRALRVVCVPEEVIENMCISFNISPDEILSIKGEYRNMALYLMKRYTGLTNKQIGQHFGGISYSGVAKVYQRFLKKLEGNSTTKKKVIKIERKLSNVKG